MARPTKLTPEVQEQIVQAVRGGNYREAAAGWAGIAAETMARWLARGLREPDSIYGKFRHALIEAEAAAEIEAVAKVRAAGVTDHKALQWWLERKFPERWGRRVIENRHANETGGPLQVIIKRVGADGGDS